MSCTTLRAVRWVMCEIVVRRCSRAFTRGVFLRGSGAVLTGVLGRAAAFKHVKTHGAWSRTRKAAWHISCADSLCPYVLPPTLVLLFLLRPPAPPMFPRSPSQKLARVSDLTLCCEWVLLGSCVFRRARGRKDQRPRENATGTLVATGDIAGWEESCPPWVESDRRARSISRVSLLGLTCHAGSSFIETRSRFDEGAKPIETRRYLVRCVFAVLKRRE